MTDIRNTTTDYVHPTDPNLLNLHKAMQFDLEGRPAVRTILNTTTVQITGPVTVLSTVTVSSTPENPVHTHVTEVGTSGLLTVPYMPVGGTVTATQGTVPWVVTGTVSINSTTVYQGTDPWTVYGTVEVNNFPSTSTVYQGTTPWVVTGTVAVGSISGIVETMPGGASATSAFGEPYGITITPVLQLDSIYGITDEVIEIFVSGIGSTSTVAPAIPVWTVESGTSSTGYAALASKRYLRYRPGQGALCRFTAGFTTSTALTSQRAGLFNRESAIQLGLHDDGVNGPRFGVLRESGGRVHITVLTITTAPTGNQTATITLDGVAFAIPLTAGTTLQTAVTINKVDGFTGWYVDQVDNTLVFSALATGPKTGVFSFSSTGAGTLAAGSFSTKQAGVATTQNWTYQSSFNIDTLDGTGNAGNPSGMLLKSQYLNVYQINFRWLGSGEIRYAIEDDSNGNMIFFHHEHYTNRNIKPHVSQPSFRIGYIAQNLGSTSSVAVTGASLMGAIEGEIKQNELNRSTSVNKTTLAQNQTHHLLTLRNPYVTNGKSGALNGNYVLNAKEIILKDISIATQGTDPSILYVFFNAASFSGTHEYFSQPRDNGMVSTVDGTLNPAVDTAICRFVSAINGQASYPMHDFRVVIPPGSSISFAINSTAQISRCTFAVVFSED